MPPFAQGTQPIGPGITELSLAQAPLWALGRVIAVEHPELWGGLIDLDVVDTIDAAASLFAQIWCSDGEDQVAFRGGQRYVARLERYRSLSNEQSVVRLRPDSTYLITGGLGGIGREIARWMVAQGARHLVLLGRSGMPSSEMDLLLDLERAGAHVVIEQADVADREQVARVLANIESSMPPLCGIIHAAGVLDDGMLRQQTWERFAGVQASKAAGAWNLHLLTLQKSLDFFVLFSSVASVLGSAGQGNYAVANAFLDTLAHYRRSLGLPAMSINWGPWAEVGMAARLNQHDEHYWTSHGMHALTVQQGLQVLGHILDHNPIQIAALRITWRTFVEHHANRTTQPMFSELLYTTERWSSDSLTEDSQPDLLNRLTVASPQERAEILTMHIHNQAAKILGFDQHVLLDPHQPLSELGLDSLLAIELRNVLRVTLRHSFSATLLIDYPTIDALSCYLMRELFDAESVEADSHSKPQAKICHEDEDTLSNLSDEGLLKLFDEELAAIDASLSKEE